MNELIFSKYPSIENIDRLKTINYIVELGLDQLPWMVSLKVHGANFQITTNSQDVKAGKRSGFIVPKDGGFNNYKSVIAKYQQNINDLYDFLKTIFPDFNQLTLYGEIFGGSYNHPDVKKDVHASRVQKGVEYCPHNDFYLFDIALDGIFINNTYNVIAQNDFGFIGNKPLYQGSFRECLQYPNEFEDPLHKKFDLPSVGEDNVCEGVVIEPEEPQFFPNGDRVILKNKNDKFAEKASHRKQKKVQMPHEWSVKGAEEYSTLVLYITDNRLRNVLSHIGEVTQKDFGVIQGLFAKDTFEDYMKDREDEFSCLNVKEQKVIKKTMNKKCADCIRPNFKNILDKEF